MVRMVRTALLLATLVAPGLGPAGARGDQPDRTAWREERRLGFLLEGALQGAAFTDGGATGGIGARLGLRVGRLVLFAAGSVMVEQRARGLDHDHGLLLAGAGLEWWLRRPWLAEAAVLAGWHPMKVAQPDTPAYQGHVLPAAGMRLAARRLWPRRWPHLSWGFAATLLADMRRERDQLRGGRVGGFAGLLSLTLAIEP